jgi:hypothetical protein
MPRYRAAGSGAVIETSSPIYSNVDDRYPKAPRGKHGSESSIQHKLQPDFEAPRYMDDALGPRPAETGSGYPRKSGKSAYPSKEATQITHSLDRGVERGIPNRNRFTQRAGNVGSGFSKRKMKPAT